MSLITRCPSCGTMFKVVPDQLRISEGWVRCGNCADVFDASENLQKDLPATDGPATAATARVVVTQKDMPSASSAALPVPNAGMSSRAEPPAVPPRTFAGPIPPALQSSQSIHPTAPPVAAEPEQDLPPSKAAVWVRRSPAAQSVLHQSSGQTAQGLDGTTVRDHTATDSTGSSLPPFDADPPARALHGTAQVRSSTSAASSPIPPAAPPAADYKAIEDRIDWPSAPDDGETEDDLEPLPVLTEDVPSALLLQTADSDESQDQLYQPALAIPVAPPAGTAEAEAEDPADRLPLEAIGFVRAAERRAFWRRPAVLAALALACLALACVLAAQVAVHERDRLAAALPGLRPSLEALCAPLHCTIAPVRQIDAVVIDGSAFNKTRGELYQLSVDLRNTAGLPVAMPALELTLTDAEDQPLLRRVLDPAELHAPLLLPVRGAWSGTLPVRLDEPAGSASRVAGYRLLAFYP